MTAPRDFRRKLISDVVAAAGTQHGTAVSRGCSKASPCAPANWQQLEGSNLTHIGTAVDSVTFALCLDAMAHPGKGIKGAGSVSRLPPDVCDHPYGTGFDEAKTTAYLAVADSLTSSNGAAAPKVAREPAVRKVFRKR